MISVDYNYRTSLRNTLYHQRSLKYYSLKGMPAFLRILQKHHLLREAISLTVVLPIVILELTSTTLADRPCCCLRHAYLLGPGILMFCTVTLKGTSKWTVKQRWQIWRCSSLWLLKLIIYGSKYNWIIHSEA